ncbi:MAG TPA: membrane protein insertase YidC [Streptosporangiaceae bacterium]
MGILNPFYEAVAWVLLRLHSLLSLAFGASSGWSWALSIILLVILMRLILLPLFVKQMHAQRKMQALAPQVQALRKKYKNDKQTMNQEVMKLYQENGANPLAGCLPLVVQLPVFFALFNVLRAIAEDEPKYGISKAVLKTAQHSHILFATISDRIVTSPLPPYHLAPGSVSSKIEIGIVVLISATTTFMTVRQSVKRGIGQPGQDPNNPMANSQKYMMYIAPLFALSGLYWQFGLVMYWVTTNLWTLGQQYVLFRNMAPITAGAADAASATAPAAKGSPGPAGTTVSRGATGKSASPRGTGAKPAAKGTAVKGTAAKSGTASTGSAKAAAAATTAKSGTKVSNGQSSSNGQRSSSQRASGQRGSSPGATSESGRAQRTTTTSRPQTAKSPSSKPAETSDGGERRGLGRLVRSSKPEPEPEPEVPATKLVRQQPVRQSRSKRSGKR